MSALPALRPEGLTPERSAQLLSDAIEAIDRVATPADAVVLLGQVQAVEAVVRLADLGRRYEREWVCLRLRAEWKYGKLLGPAEHGGDRRTRPSSRRELDPVSEAEKKARVKARKVADVPVPVFDAYLANAIEPTRAGLLRATKAPPESSDPEDEIMDMPVVDTQPLVGRSLVVAEANKRKIIVGLAHLSGLSASFHSLNIDAARHVFTDDELRHWTRVLGEAVSQLRQFQHELVKGRV